MMPSRSADPEGIIAWHLASGIWHLASGIRHPASGIRHPASGIRHLASRIRHLLGAAGNCEQITYRLHLPARRLSSRLMAMPIVRSVKS
jgi:hypothetical protein